MDRGGAPDIVKSLFRHLKISGYEVNLISGPTIDPSRDTLNFLKEYKDSLILVHELRRNPNLISDLAAFIRLFFIFMGNKFDIVHTHTAKAGFIARITAKLAGIKIVLHTPHGNNLYGYFSNWFRPIVVMLERIASFFSDKIIVLTQLEKRDLLKFHICPQEKIEVVHSGIKLEEFAYEKVDIEAKKQELKISAEDFVVGAVMRLETVKGPGYFLEAAKLIAEKLPHSRFLVVGDGPLRESLLLRNRELGLKDKVKFLGWREDVSELLSILDVLVLPSLNEAVGRVILEAGACCRPAVATRVGGIPEVIHDGLTGILVLPAQPEKIAEAVTKLLNDEEIRHKMGQAAREWVRANFSEAKMVEGFMKIYEASLKP
jgi:glycosyltransferase involved in cell wall biosynthesis